MRDCLCVASLERMLKAPGSAQGLLRTDTRASAPSWAAELRVPRLGTSAHPPAHRHTALSRVVRRRHFETWSISCLKAVCHFAGGSNFLLPEERIRGPCPQVISGNCCSQSRPSPCAGAASGPGRSPPWEAVWQRASVLMLPSSKSENHKE